MQTPSVVGADRILSFIKPSGRDFSLRVGDFVKAEVLEIMENGYALLRLTPESGRGGVIRAKSEAPLAAGDDILLKVLGGEGEIRLQYAGKAAASGVGESISKAVMDLFGRLSGSKPKAEDINAANSVLRALPEKLKEAFPQLRVLENVMPEISNLNGGILKDSVERSGVLFETKLKFAASSGSGEGEGKAVSALLRTDAKAALLELHEILIQSGAAAELRSAGIRPSDALSAVERLIGNIEFFQASSAADGVLHTFLPAAWRELRDAELSFKAEKGAHGEEVYGCDLNLDLEPSGRISASVKLFAGSFYLTINADRPETHSLLDSSREELVKNFSASGLLLAAVNIGKKTEVAFSSKSGGGVDIRT